jgi:hypothetical protein
MGSEEPTLCGIADMRKRCMSAPPGEDALGLKAEIYICKASQGALSA